MAEQTDTKEKHSVEAVHWKRPVEAVCKAVQPAKERTLSCREVKPATVRVPAYQTVGQVHETELTLQSVDLPTEESLSTQQADRIRSSELIFDDIKSKNVRDNLTLRELFSGQEGY